jgi:hypothetical protein
MNDAASPSAAMTAAERVINSLVCMGRDSGLGIRDSGFARLRSL